MSIDWYRARLGGSTPAGPARPAAVPQQPPKFVIGPDGRAYPLAPPGEQPPEAPPWAQQPPQQPQQGYPTQVQAAGMPSQVQAPIGQIHVAEGVQYWRGTADAQTKAAGCPRCGSPNYFSQMVAGLQDGVAGESGKLSMGHCFQCGYRHNPSRGAPSEQMKGLRGAKADADIPVEQARAPYTPAFKGFGIIAKVN